MKSSWGILLAAGSGIRMGTPKAFLHLNGKPLLSYSLEAFQRCSLIHKIGIVCREEDREAVKNLVGSSSITKLGFVIAGGQERQDSAWAGIQSLPAEAEFVAVHDTARPLITVLLLEKVLEAAQETGAALIAVPVRDTVKLVSDRRVRNSLNREELWYAQTPQAFRVELFKKAFRKAREENFYATDCAGLVERLGVFPVPVEGSPENLKITTAADLQIAEAILSLRPAR